MNAILIFFLLAISSFPNLAYSQDSSTLNRIDSLYKEGRHDLASSAISEVLSDSVYQQKPRSWVLKGKIYHDFAKVTSIDDFAQKIERLKTAYNGYVKALEIDTASAASDEALFNILTIEDEIYKLAMSQIEDENYPGAYKAFRFLVNSRKESPALSRQEIETDILYELAHTASLTGRMKEAKEIYQKLREKDYQKAKLYFGLAEVYKNKEQYKKAVKILGEGYDQHPGNLELLFEQTSILLNHGKHEKAAQKLETAVANLDTASAELHFRLGIVYDEMDQLQKAGQHYTRATELRPAYYRAHYNMGVMYYNRAIEMNKKLQEIGEFDSTYAAIMEKRDRYLNKARPHFRKATDLKPEQHDLDNILSDINQTLE